MTPTVYLWVDPRGWPTPLDPDLLSAIPQARLQPSVAMMPGEISARMIGEHWFDELPSEPCVVILLLTRPVIAGWLPITDRWLNSSHRLYVIYTDGLSTADIREFARITAEQPVARAPYRIAQLNAAGLENAMQWVSGILQKAGTSNVTPGPPPLKLLPARWRHLPSNLQDDYYYPEDFNVSMNGAAHYRLVAASHRGKTHAHQGTFREDAVAVTATDYWNIMAVADGAGTADLARVGSNLAGTPPAAPLSRARPNPPAGAKVGPAIWAGLCAPHHPSHCSLT